jgi:hypothetical protein
VDCSAAGYHVIPHDLPPIVTVLSLKGNKYVNINTG